MLQGCVALPLCLAMAVHFLLWNWEHPLQGQSLPASFEIRVLDQQPIAGQPLTLSVQALDPDGNPSESWQGNVTLRTLIPAATTPVLSEINLGLGSIEVTNPGDESLDVSRWQLQAWSSGYYYNFGNLWTQVPEGSILPGRSVFTWTPFSSTPSSFPQLSGSHGLGTTVAGNVFFRLLDASGNTIDQVWIGTPPTLLADMDLRGPVLFPPSLGGSMLRQGHQNQSSSQDWTNGTPSLGVTNSTLNLPWAPVQAKELAHILLTDGAWTGDVLLPSIGSGNLTILAEDATGRFGSISSIPLRAAPRLTLSLPLSAAQASEASPGVVGEAIISMPSPLTAPLDIHLSLDASGEFSIPSSVTIPSGFNSVSVPFSNLNDGVPDGDALVTLTASAPGFIAATGALRNKDHEAVSLTVLAPASLPENIGLSALNGHLLLPFVATHAVSVRLAAEPPLRIPGELVIPAGARSADFAIGLDNDSAANFTPYKSTISAHTGSGGLAKAAVSVIDDERQFYSITFPTLLTEGSTTNGHIRLAVAHAADLQIPISSSSTRLSLPAVVVVRAGVLDVDFPVVAPNDDATNGVADVSAAYSFGDGALQFTRITLWDDEIDVRRVGLGGKATCFLGSIPTLWQSGTLNQYNGVERYNGPGRLSLGELAKASIQPQSVQFANGLWSGNVTFTGEDLNLTLKMSVAGTNSDLMHVQVLQGSLLSQPVLDFASAPGISKLLALAAPTNNTPALLMEVDATSGTTSRILELPRRANRIALSEDGAVAWLASSTGTLQRVDLSAWKFDREVTLTSIVPSPRPLDVVVLPGGRERVAVIVAGNRPSTTKVALLEGGNLVGATVTLEDPVFNLNLISGRNGNEAFSRTTGLLSRYRLGAEGVTLVASVQLPNSSSEQPNLTLSGNRLYHGDGAIFHADNLTRILENFLPDGLTLVSEARHTQLLVDRNSTSVKVRALDSWAPLTGHELPYRPMKGSRLAPWGDRGLAYIEETGAKLVMVESPLMDAQQPNLGLHLDPFPDIQLDHWESGYKPTGGQLSYVISNSGPTFARGNILESTQSPHQTLLIPDLAPGESTRVSLPLYASTPGLFRVRTAILSASGSSSPNAILETTVRATGPEQAGVRELIFGATAIAGNPAGDRLYASISKAAGDSRDGVAIFDPETGTELSFLEVVGTPGKLRTSDDGSMLYARVGTNGLVRWNLATGSKEVSILIPNDSILDFLPVAGNPRSVVVATTTQVLLYLDADPLPLSVFAETGDSRLAYSGTNLWSYTPTTLRRLSVKPGGLETEFSGNTLPTSFGEPFLIGDGTYLFASGQPLHLDTMTLADRTPEAEGLVIDPSSGELLGCSYGVLRRFARETFSTLEAQAFSPNDRCWGPPVLWGTDGIAILTSSQQILLIHSPLRHSGAEADLAVSITPPANPVAEESAIWQVSVTNQSAAASRPVRLTIRAIGSPVGPFSFEGLTMIPRADEFVGIFPSIPAHSRSVVLVHGIPLNGGSRLEASILSTSPDPTLEDHSAVSDLTAAYPKGDLALMTLAPPAPIKVGFPSPFALTVSNAGPTTIRQTSVAVTSLRNGMHLSAFRCEGCQLQDFDGTLSIRTQPLEPRQTWTLRFDATATLPGIYDVRMQVGGWLDDLNPDNNGAGVNLFTETPLAPGVLASLGYSGIRTATWSAQRDQLLVLPTADPALWMVDPNNLITTNRIGLPGLPTDVSDCQDGLHAWVLTADRRASLVNLQTYMIEHSFSYDSEGGRAIAIASLPGSHETVVMAILAPNDTGQVVVRQFVKGVATGEPLTEAPTGFVWTKFLFLKNGHLVVQTPSTLRTYLLNREGIQLQLNLDSAAWSSSVPDDPQEIEGGLMLRMGRRVRFDTQQIIDPPPNYASYVLDETHGLILRASNFDPILRNRVLRVEGFDPLSLQPRFLADLEDSGLTINRDKTRMLTLGAHGILILSDLGSVFRLSDFEPAQVRLSAGFKPTEAVELSPADLELTLCVTNSSVWAVRQGAIDVSLPPGMTFSPGSVGAGSNPLRLPLDGFLGVSNIVLMVRSETAGEVTVTATIHSDPADVSSNSVTASTTINVLPPPMLLFPDIVVREGTAASRGSLTVRLSRPMGRLAEVQYTTSFVTASAADIVSQSGVIAFPPNQTLAVLSFVVRDSLPEWDETLRLRLSSKDISLLQSEVEITLLDDDLPVLSATPVAQMEGNDGSIPAEVTLNLSRPTPRPVHVHYATLEGTALAGQDFLTRAGWVSFAPGQTSAIVRVPIVTDTRREPNETFSLELLDATHAMRSVDRVIVTILNDDNRPAILSVDLDPPFVNLTFESAPSTDYRVEFTADPGSTVWSTFPDPITGTGSAMTISLELPEARSRFFRIVGQ
ncbi:MAG: hypothetical protein JNN07_07465 [Verrucomicrobiales bacterium]|nr:hypothetical protein [Verrucomicrobiales bacterium]